MGIEIGTNQIGSSLLEIRTETTCSGSTYLDSNLAISYALPVAHTLIVHMYVFFMHIYLSYINFLIYIFDDVAVESVYFQKYDIHIVLILCTRLIVQLFNLGRCLFTGFKKKITVELLETFY